MKRYFLNQLSAFCLWGLAIGLTMTACSEEDNEKSNPSQPAIEDFNQPDLNFTEQPGSQSFTFTAHEDWVVSVAPVDGVSWCTVSPSSGTAGTHTVTISLEENEDYDDRSVTITLEAGTMVETFVVTQKQKDALLLSADKFEVPQEGGTVTVEAKANVTYTASIGEECRDWITESPGTRGLTAATKSFTVAPNRSGDKREGTITFSNGTLTETVHVYQASGDVILLTKDVFYADPAGDELQVELRSNCEYEVIMPRVYWVQQATTRALSSHTLYYTILPNTLYYDRDARIIYRSKQNPSVCDTLTIYQNAKNTLVLSEREVVVEKEGGVVAVKLSTNLNYAVHMPADADWITAISTKNVETYTLRYNVAPNNERMVRSAKIIFSSEESMLYDTLTVVQNGENAEYMKIDVPYSGHLSRLLPDVANIRNLIISGYLDGDDIRYIREMPLLYYLDLSEANIVEGGGTYWNTAAGHYPQESYKTSNNIVGKYMFSGLENLGVCILPNSTLKIDDYAFKASSNLTELIIPEGVTSIGALAFRQCNRLETVVLPQSLTTIGGSAFSESGLKYITIPGSVTELSGFSNCPNLTRVTIEEGVTEVNGFSKSGLVEIDLPKSIVEIGNWAFSNCPNLKKVTMQGNVKTIGRGAFEGCSSLTDIVIPESVTSLGESVFQGCSSLVDITVPGGITDIPENAFRDCGNLTNATLQEGVVNVGKYAFMGCSGLKIFRTPSTIDYFDYWSMDGCGSLSEFWCYALEAPSATFGGINYNGTLFIPKEGTGYSSYPWNEFDKISRF